MPVIPKAQSARIREINDVFWRSLDDSLDSLDDQIARRSRSAMQKIRKANYSARAIRRETKKITAGTADDTARMMAQQVEAAALYAQRAADVLRAWQVGNALKDPAAHLLVSDSALQRARLPGATAVDAEATLARIKIAPLRTQKEVSKALTKHGSRKAAQRQGKVTTDGTRAMAKLRKTGLVRSSREIGLSARLHGSNALNTKLTNDAVNTAIREASNINKAGRDLTNALVSEGSELSVNRKLTEPLLRLRRSSRKLQLLSVNKADPDALKLATKQFNRDFAEIKRITASRVDARGQWLELQQQLDVQKAVTAAQKRERGQAFRVLKVRKAEYEAATKKQITQWTAEESARRTDAALDRWLDNKQSYHAERIVETETAGAYRAREYEQHANKPYIVGFWWRRNPGMLSLDKRRIKDIKRVRRNKTSNGRNAKRKVKGAPCRTCPALADLRFPVEYARDYPRGAHPSCRCWYEWIYDAGIRDRQPVTQADVDWYESLPA